MPSNTTPTGRKIKKYFVLDFRKAIFSFRQAETETMNGDCRGSDVVGMIQILNITQIVISILLATGILLQQRSGGLSPIFGGEGGFYRTRRGIERFVFWGTVGLAILFLATAFLNIVLR